MSYDNAESLIRIQIALGNMDGQPSGDTAKHLCGIIDKLRAALQSAKEDAERARARLGLLIDKPHAERIKEFLSELAEYLGLDDGAKIPEDFINAASSIRQGMETQASKLATLAAEVESLRADKERLDWLGSILTATIHQHSDYYEEAGISGRRPNTEGRVDLFTIESQHITNAPSLRAAIDAARAGRTG